MALKRIIFVAKRVKMFRFVSNYQINGFFNDSFKTLHWLPLLLDCFCFVSENENFLCNSQPNSTKRNDRCCEQMKIYREKRTIDMLHLSWLMSPNIYPTNRLEVFCLQTQSSWHYPECACDNQLCQNKSTLQSASITLRQLITLYLTELHYLNEPCSLSICQETITLSQEWVPVITYIITALHVLAQRWGAEWNAFTSRRSQFAFTTVLNFPF